MIESYDKSKVEVRWASKSGETFDTMPEEVRARRSEEKVYKKLSDDDKSWTGPRS